MGFFILILVIAVPFVLWGIIDPKGAWRATESWKYKNPEANEPSETSYALSRIGGVVSLVAIMVMITMMYGLSRDTEEARQRAAEPTSSYQIPDLTPRYTDVAMGAGTLVGYVYPSEHTIEFVVLQRPDPGIFISCPTGVSIYEHTNAIVVQVTAEASRISGALDEPMSEKELVGKCAAQQPVAQTQSRDLVHPIGDRPILTAAPLADPAEFGLAYGPRVRPEPLAEVPQPGVVERQQRVRIDPAWKPVPLLAGTAQTLP